VSASAVQHHIALAHTPLRTRAEAAAVAGFTQACRAVSLSAAAWPIATAPSRPNAAVTVLFSAASDVTPELLADPSVVWFPFVRHANDMARLAAGARPQQTWIASPALEPPLRALGAKVCDVGASCHTGLPTYLGRQTLGLRETDFVFVAPVGDFDYEAAACLRDAIARRTTSNATRFARDSYALDISEAPASAKEKWLAFGAGASDAVTLCDGPHGRADALLAAADCAVVLEADAWFPWFAADALCRGKRVITCTDLSALGLAEQTARDRVACVSAAQPGAAAHLVAAMDAAASAPRLSAWDPWCRSRFSARATGCRIVRALQHGGHWGRIAACPSP
jgi:hypothetical protein